MGDPRTPAQLHAQLCNLYNIPLVPQGQAWPNLAARTDAINAGMRVYQEMATKAYGHYHMERVENLVCIPPAYAVQLPPDFVRMVDGPYVSTDSVNYSGLAPAGRGFEGLLPGEDAGEPRYYLLSEGAMVFAPRCEKTTYIRFRYTSMPLRLDLNDISTQLDGVYGWDELVVLYAAKRLAITDRKDPSWLQNMYKEAQASVKAALSPADEGAIVQIVDVDEPSMGGPTPDQEAYTWLRSGPAYRRMP